MKKGFVLLVLFNFILLLASPSAAQRLNLNIKPKDENISVKYTGIEAITDGQGTLIKWSTEFEGENLGFNIYRISADGAQLVNSTIIAGAYLQMRGNQFFGKTYTYFDAEGDLSSTYYVESININGQKATSNLFSSKYLGNLPAPDAELFEAFKRGPESTKNPSISKNEVNIPEELQSEVAQSAVQADFDKQRWVAAQPGVKIGVQKEGIYRVTRAELQAAGFTNNSPALWQLYVNGVEQSIIVGGNGDYIEFYGKGVDTNEANTQIYFLVVGTQNGKRIANTFRRAIRSPVASNSYLQSFTFKERTIYSSGIYNGDDKANFFGRVIGDTTQTIPLNLAAVDFGIATSSINISLQGVTQVSHQVRVSLNGTQVGVVNGFSTSFMNQTFTFPTSVLREGANSLQLTSIGGSQDVSFFDTVNINYARQFQAAQNRLSFYTPNYRAVYLRGFSSPNIRVFDISSPDNVSLVANLQIQQNGSSYQVYLPSNRGRIMYAVENSGILQAASIVSNTPSTISAATRNGDLVIISYKDWMTEAENWANNRRASGLSVEVVNIEDVYDEFNYGVFSSNAIRSFLEYAKNNWQTKPKYALLLGDATLDPRNYTGNGLYNYIPTKMVETIYLETGSDEALADFDNDGLSEIAIGRIPAHDAQDVTRALNKVSVFEQTLALGQGLERGVIFASDLPIGYDFAAVNARLATKLPTSTSKTFINRSATDAHTQLITQINSGKFMVSYSGHGSTEIWGDAAFFGINDAAQLTNGGSKLSLFTMLSCLNGYFMQPVDSLSETLLKNQNGGAVAAWSSTGLTTPDVQEIMATQFYTQLAAGNMTRFGDLIKDSKTVIPGGRDVRLSWALLGDPTLKVR